MRVGLPDTAVGREGGADDVECPVGDLVQQARERRLPALGEAPAVDRVAKSSDSWAAKSHSLRLGRIVLGMARAARVRS